MAATTTRVIMPQLGESVHEGTISKWLVKPGDKVVEFEPMLEVDTDKVSAEVPAPVSGVLREILAKEGETVQAGAEIAVVEIGSNGGTVPSPPSGERVRERGEEAPAQAPAPSPFAGEVAAKRPDGASPTQPPTADRLDSGEHRYSPAVQMVASDLKVDLAQVTGTGIGGRVTKLDVQNFAANAKTAPTAPAAAAVSYTHLTLPTKA